ncbi:ogr/Delta-like zinc finger family protein [Vibrio parahaemolyticus]|nr:transcriptional regulator [Vibrio alginolyticus]EHR1162083.1 ogr/Delta-like zinc finger family protein [Vibrio parahaemolyticus]ELA9431982.1 ogr/Delta-like zinc finger family protein [Vibrio parahaemolyticus]
MRVYCKCGERAVISRSNAADANCAELSCSCSNPDCGHTFVSAIGYKHSLKPSTLHLGIGAASKPSMFGSRVFCGCGERAVIKKTNRLSNDCADLYCECKNPACEHQFVMSLYFSHTLSPSSKTTSELAQALVKSLPPQKRLELSTQLSMF